MSSETIKLKKQLRRAVANYMRSEGCDCCRGHKHGEYEKRLAKLLDVEKYDDGSGFDFNKYSFKPIKL